MLNVAKALNRPYSVIVLAILVTVIGIVSAVSTPTDVFPNIDIPVASVIWFYAGASPVDMEKRIVELAERSYNSSVNDIQHIESQSMPGASVIKVFFQPGAKVEGGVAQLTATSQSVLKLLPPGITPPLIIQFSASSVPILQIGLSSNTVSEQKLYDLAQNFVRIQLATTEGSAIPSPYGGKPRQIMVDVDPKALQEKGLTAMDVTSAINLQNLILPSGTIKMAEREYEVSINSSPSIIDALNNLPIRSIHGAMVYLRDVAQVHDGYAVQTNVVDRDGHRSVLLTVLKSGSASTLSVVDKVLAILPRVRSTLPPGVKLDVVSDQSTFVRASVSSVIREGVIAACLTAAMILFFLGSWRSTLIVAMSIPLSILFAVTALKATGQTINVMTLGGLALAIGILVDNAIVSIENIYRNLGLGKNLRRAIIDGAEQIAAPQLVSTMAICIVFLPILFLSGAAGSLFKPLAMSVVFSMIFSYVLSRTFVPVMAERLLGPELHLHAHGHEPVEDNATSPRHHEPNPNSKHDVTHAAPKGDLVWQVHVHFNRYFEKLLDKYRAFIHFAMKRRGTVIACFIGFFALSFCLLPFIGQDFFPAVDSGSFRLHVRAPSGTRLEETAKIFAQVEDTVRKTLPVGEVNLTMDNIGLPVGGVNFAYNTTGAIGPSDGEILVVLKEGHSPTAEHIKILRNVLAKAYPDCEFFFQPADITTQILNFGLPAPLDIQVVGNDKRNYSIAQKVADAVRLIPGAVDVHIHQVVDDPELRVQVDRDRAQEIGLTQRDVANNLLIALSSSGQVLPNYWLDPNNGVSYLLAVQVPQRSLSSISDLENTTVSDTRSEQPAEMLSNIATFQRRLAPAVINHYNIQPCYDIYANVQGRDLGGVAGDIDSVLHRMRPTLPAGTLLVMRGQIDSMRSSFIGLGAGLVFAIFLVYLLLVVNYQSWVDPFIIISALPGALSGIVIILFLWNTTFSVPALMGAIMCVGVSTANSILVITFANDLRATGLDSVTAAVTAGCTRLRPVLMTAGAMILGMLPMALGIGEGAEQNAPLGRAVIGGLTVATATTLMFVPLVYSLLRKRALVADPHSEPASGSVVNPAVAH
jgi:multidrug efflux pump subunit AcrB